MLRVFHSFRNLKEFIRMFFTSIPDVFCIECCTDEEYQQVARFSLYGWF